MINAGGLLELDACVFFIFRGGGGCRTDIETTVEQNGCTVNGVQEQRQAGRQAGEE